MYNSYRTRTVKHKEWEPGYEPRQMYTPGLGIKDFVSDVGQIVSNRSGRSRKGRKITTGRRNNRRGSSGNTGLYRLPGTASAMSLQCDDDPDGQGKIDHGGSAAGGGGDTLKSYSCDSDIASDDDDEGDQFPIHDDYDNDGTTINEDLSSSPVGQQTNRNRIVSDGTDSAELV